MRSLGSQIWYLHRLVSIETKRSHLPETGRRDRLDLRRYSGYLLDGWGIGRWVVGWLGGWVAGEWDGRLGGCVVGWLGELAPKWLDGWAVGWLAGGILQKK